MTDPDHVCEYTLYSHHSYYKDTGVPVYLCERSDCPSWAYGFNGEYGEPDATEDDEAA